MSKGTDPKVVRMTPAINPLLFLVCNRGGIRVTVDSTGRLAGSLGMFEGFKKRKTPNM